MDLSSLLEVEVKEGKASELQDNGEIAAYKNIPDFSIRDIASVRFRKLHCTACDLHIGSAPASAHNMHEHPILHVLLCTACRNFYGDGTFEQGDDATDMFCRWCANGGNLYCCSYCSNTFCYNCIKRNFDPMVRKKIERDEKWKCFVCNPADLYTARAACWALLQHVQTVKRILQSDTKMSRKEIEAKMNLDESQCCLHRSKRKRSETVSDDEEQDETYNMPRKKRRKLLNARRRRRDVKMEMRETTSQESSNERIVNHDGFYYADARGNRASKPNSTNERILRKIQEELPLALRQRPQRLRVETPILPKIPITDDDLPPTLLECDQTMIEGAESLSFDSAQAPSVGVAANVETIARNIGINPVPMANLMKIPGPPVIAPKAPRTHRLVRGTDGTPVLVRKIQTSGINNINKVTPSGQSHPMVTIPSLNHVQSVSRASVIQQSTRDDQDSPNSASPSLRSVLLRPPPAAASRTAERRATNVPSVIDLDSDSDDPVVVNPTTNDKLQNSPVDGASSLSTTTYPLRPDDGLMTIITATSDKTENRDVDRDRETEINIDEATSEAAKSINAVLDTLKCKFKSVLDAASFSQEKDSTLAKNKARVVHRTLKRTIAELNSLNDNLVRSYRDYKRECTKNDENRTKFVRREGRWRTSRFVLLDMECTRESEPELDVNISEDDDEEGDDDDDGDDSTTFPRVREVRPIRRKVHRAVEAKPTTKNKSVQSDDCGSCDYDKSIGYSLLLRADYDVNRHRDVLCPVMVPDENFGKYEEEFINYIQKLEDESTEPTEIVSFGDDREGPTVNELVEADISKMMSEMTNVDDESSITDAKDHLTDENIEILEEHVEILTTKSVTSEESSSSETSSSSEDFDARTEPSGENNDTRVKKIVDTAAAPKKTRENKKTGGDDFIVYKKTDSTSDKVASKKNNGRRKGGGNVDEETVLAVRALIEEDDSAGKRDILKTWKAVESDDECTILD